jgi:3-deoxy-manno-octulosonate cytidylyltransferase (CMP-KDO synthetase)
MPAILGVIPARLASTRLPGKVLRPLLGRPMLQWVVEAALRCPQLDQILIATDSEAVADLCNSNGWLCQMTDPDLPSGTDRMRAVALDREADIYVNIQGDEPMLKPEHIDALLRPFARGPHVECTTVKTACAPENITNPNAVKVVNATDGRALYFSRATIPYDRDANLAGDPTNGKAVYWKHLGLYAYRRPALLRFGTLEASPLEQTERLEQLRLLENGLALYVEPVDFDTVGVDTEEDIPRVEDLLRDRFGY